MEDGGAGGLSAIGDGEQAAISLMPDDDRTQVCIFESLQLEGFYVRDLFEVLDWSKSNVLKKTLGGNTIVCILPVRENENYLFIL